MNTSAVVTEVHQPAAAGVPCQVRSLAWLSSSVVRVFLNLPDDFPRCPPGQYVELVLDDGTVRPFSIANYSPAAPLLELHIEVAPGRSTASRLVRQLEETGYVRAKPPKGTVRLRPTLGDQVFFAAGTGFAQIKALLEQHFHIRNGRDERLPRIHLFWGADSADQRYLEDQVLDWCRHYPELHYHPLNWQSGHSWETAATAVIDALPRCQVYACGSPERVHRALEHLQGHGLPASRMQSDVFAYAPRATKASA